MKSPKSPYTDKQSSPENKGETMEKPCEMPAFGFDTNWRMRAPSDLVTRMHVHARSKGLTSSSWVRLLVIEALEEAERASGIHHEAA